MWGLSVLLWFLSDVIHVIYQKMCNYQIMKKVKMNNHEFNWRNESLPMSLGLNVHSSPFHPSPSPNPYGSILFIIPLLLKRNINFALCLCLNRELSFIWGLCKNGIILHAVFCCLIFLLNVLFLKLTHCVPCSRRSITSTAVKYSTP